MALVNEGGSLRVVSGALGTGQACCCGGNACCLPEGCYAEVTALFVDLDLDTGLIFCPSEPPPAPDGYTLFESRCVGDTRVSTFRKTLDPNSCENPDPEDIGTAETMFQHFSQVSQLPGPPGKFDGGGEVFVYSTGGCQDGLSQSECEAQGGTYHPGKTCGQAPCCCITPPQPFFPDCANVNPTFFVQCSNLCEECTCADVNAAGSYGECLDGLAAVLQQQGYDPISYDHYAVTGPTECSTGFYLYGRDVVACCNGEISNVIADAVQWRPAWGGEPCQWCNITDGAFVGNDNMIYVKKCVNPLP